MHPLDKTTDKQLTVINISDLLRRNIFQNNVCFLLYIKKKRENEWFQQHAKRHLVTMICDSGHTLIVIFLSAPQMANISIESLLDETSCTDLPLCNIILQH